jgi:hypothetical protein
MEMFINVLLFLIVIFMFGYVGEPWEMRVLTHSTRWVSDWVAQAGRSDGSSSSSSQSSPLPAKAATHKNNLYPVLRKQTYESRPSMGTM